MAGILLISERLQQKCCEVFHLTINNRQPMALRWGKLLLRSLSAVVCTTLGAMAATVPLTALYFKSLSLIAPLANLLTLWAVTVIFAGGMGVGALSLSAPDLARALAAPVSWLAEYVEGCVNWFSTLPFAALSLDSLFYQLWLVLCYALILGAFLIPGRKRWYIPVGCAGACLAVGIFCTALVYRGGPMTITALDVGQGQSVLLRCGDEMILADCGGDSYDDPGDLAADYLQSRGYTRLDMLVLTHCHADHANGVPQLLRRIPVDKLVLPEGETDDLTREILDLAEETGTEVHFIRSETALDLPGGGALTLYPPVTAEEDENERGLALMVENGDFRALITGDMGGETEKLFLTAVPLPTVELLVAGHHGSDRSNTPEFLSTIRPSVCIISVGAHNRYGHPGEETLSRLGELGTEVYRTDRSGNITIHVNDK